MRRGKRTVRPSTRSRAGRLSILLWGAAALLGGATGTIVAGGANRASANPAPYGFVLMHVHEDDGSSLCESPGAELPVSTCLEIVQVTDRTGPLIFDLIAYPFYGYPDDMLEILYELSTNVSFTIQWPAGWRFVRAEACGSGATGVERVGNSATFSIEDLRGAPATGILVGVGRVVLDATSTGSVSCISSGWSYGPDWSQGRAGVPCGNCVRDDCAHYCPNRPVPVPSSLAMVSDANGLATAQFHVDTEGMEHGAHEYTFSVSETWLAPEAHSVGEPWWPEYDVQVRVDAAGLESGWYEGWIEVHASYCFECVHIALHVPVTVPPAVDAETWGRVKARFQR